MGPFLIGFFMLVTIVGICLILYFTAYNKLSVIKIKMDNSNNIIADNLAKKQEIMEKLYEKIKSVVTSKDYLKEFNNLKNKNLNNYELDKELNEYLQIMINLKEDNKKLNTKAFNKSITEIKQIDQIIRANKVFFNKNNNDLFKQMKGYTKIVAKIAKISVKNSYEIKEPIDNSL